MIYMSFCLYSVLPTEIVWKIYEDTHRLRLKDLHKELGEAIGYAEGAETPYACLIGECECEGDVYPNGKYYHCYSSYHWDAYDRWRVRPIVEAHKELMWMERNEGRSIEEHRMEEYEKYLEKHPEERINWSSSDESSSEDEHRSRTPSPPPKKKIARRKRVVKKI